MSTEPEEVEEVEEPIERSGYNIAETKFVGQFKHVIRLYYPCHMFEDVRGPHGQPPELSLIATVLARHKRECEDGCV